MNLEQSDEQQYFVVYKDDEWTDLVFHDALRQKAHGRAVTCDVWHAVFPIVLAQDPVLLAALITMDVGDSLNVGFDDEIRSLYTLLAILAATGSPTRAAEVARSWVQLPLDQRWWHGADCDKPLHAQILAATSTSAVTLDSVVPDWLFKLVKASRGGQAVRDDRELHWTSAETSLGKSCIAWTDNDETSPRACLAISDCGVQFSRADDPELSLAKQAVTKLCDALEVIVSNPKLAEELEWSATGHDLMEIEDVLRSWTQCLSSAAEAAKARGMSTAEAWEWIRDHGSGRMAG